MCTMPGSPLSVRRSWPGREGTFIAWSADGSRFASAIRSTITVSGADPGDDESRIDTAGPVLSLAFRGDRLLAAPYQIGIADSAVLTTVTAALDVGLPAEARGSYALRAAAWSPDGVLAVLAGTYQPPRGIPARAGRPGPAARVVLSTDDATLLWEGTTVGELVVGAGASWVVFADTAVRVVPRSDPGSPPREWATPDAAVRALAFDSTESRLAVGSADGTVRICSSPDGGIAATWQAQPADVYALAWAGDRLITGGGDGTVRLWDADGGALGATDPREFQPIVALAVHPDGSVVRASVGGPRAELLEIDLPDR